MTLTMTCAKRCKGSSLREDIEQIKTKSSKSFSYTDYDDDNDLLESTQWLAHLSVEDIAAPFFRRPVLDTGPPPQAHMTRFANPC